MTFMSMGLRVIQKRTGRNVEVHGQQHAGGMQTSRFLLLVDPNNTLGF
jgi:hypothetical protein